MSSCGTVITVFCLTAWEVAFLARCRGAAANQRLISGLRRYLASAR